MSKTQTLPLMHLQYYSELFFHARPIDLEAILVLELTISRLESAKKKIYIYIPTMLLLSSSYSEPMAANVLHRFFLGSYHGNLMR